MEKGEFIEETLSLEEIKEQNESIYKSYRDEYRDLLAAEKNQEEKMMVNQKNEESEDDINISSFIDHNDIETELNKFNNFDENKNENLLIESHQINEVNNKKKNDFINSNGHGKNFISIIVLYLAVSDEKFDVIIEKKRELKNKIKQYIQSIRKEYIIIFSILILLIKKFFM